MPKSKPPPPPTPVPAMDIVRSVFAGQRDSAKRRIEEFAQKLVEDPQNTMEWSIGAFRAAAQYHVAAEIMRGIEGGKVTVQTLYDYARDHALSGARFVESSTSTASNFANRHKTAAWAEAEESLRSILRSKGA